MDFIAEMVLGYIDQELSERIKKNKIVDYKVLRYRDDYKVFVKNSNDGEMILRLLSEVIMPYGLKLNSSKTRENRNIISSAVKSDKLSWFQLNQGNLTLQKQFLLIHQHSLEYPNSGSVVRALTELNKGISDKEMSIQIISITVDIMLHNPKSIPVCCSIISKILKGFDDATMRSISGKIYQCLMDTSNSGFAQIWMQRMLERRRRDFQFEEALCKIVRGDNTNMWNSTWISRRVFKRKIDSKRIFDNNLFAGMDDVIKDKEVSLFIHSL